MIRNISNNRIISKSVKFCSSPFSKFLGLMFSRERDISLIFDFEKEKIISLHMIFVFYPIDVLFLDRINLVVELKENFAPFTFYTSKKKAMYAIELPKGTIEKSGTIIGDRIEF